MRVAHACELPNAAISKAAKAKCTETVPLRFSVHCASGTHDCEGLRFVTRTLRVAIRAIDNQRLAEFRDVVRDGRSVDWTTRAQDGVTI
jgi:hypothetical protein